jgi:hypothetical protein
MSANMSSAGPAPVVGRFVPVGDVAGAAVVGGDVVGEDDPLDVVEAICGEMGVPDGIIVVIPVGSALLE